MTSRRLFETVSHDWCNRKQICHVSCRWRWRSEKHAKNTQSILTVKTETIMNIPRLAWRLSCDAVEVTVAVAPPDVPPDVPVPAELDRGSARASAFSEEWKWTVWKSVWKRTVWKSVWKSVIEDLQESVLPVRIELDCLSGRVSRGELSGRA